MNSFQWYDWVRVLTIVLCLITLARIFLRSTKRWSKYTDYMKELIWILGGCLVFIMVNSIERIADNNDVHVGFFIGFVVAAYGFTTTMRKDDLLKENSFNKPKGSS